MKGKSRVGTACSANGRPRRLYGSLVLVWGLLGVFPERVAAQDLERPVRIWASAGLGGAYVRDIDVDGAVGLHLVGQWHEHSVTIRGLFLGDLGITDGSGRSAQEASILYGRRVTTSFGYAGLSAGVGGVSAEGFGGEFTETRSTIGLPVLAEAALQTTPVGLGLQLFGNLNSVAPFGGMLVMFYFGWMP